MYAAHYLPRMGYAKRAHLMNAMVPGLSGGKMSSSDPKSKIDFLDKPSEIKAKLKAAVCTPGEVEGNGVLAFVKTVLIPVQELWLEQAKTEGRPEPTGEKSFAREGAPAGTLFSIARPEKFGGDIHFSSYKALEEAYAKEEIHPGDLKGGVVEALVKLLSPVQKMFEADAEWQEAERLGYPSASTAVAMASAKQGAGNKSEAKVGHSIVSSKLAADADAIQDKKKDARKAPPTEEERAALRAQKEQEKLAKAQAKAAENNLGPDELKDRQAKAAAVEPQAGAASGSGSQQTVSSPQTS